MKYIMALASVGALLLSTPSFADPSHGQNGQASFQSQSGDDDHFRGDGDHDRDDLMNVVRNPHCDGDDRHGPDGDRDDHAANNPGRGHHYGRCHQRPVSP